MGNPEDRVIRLYAAVAATWATWYLLWRRPSSTTLVGGDHAWIAPWVGVLGVALWLAAFGWGAVVARRSTLVAVSAPEAQWGLLSPRPRTETLGPHWRRTVVRRLAAAAVVGALLPHVWTVAPRAQHRLTTGLVVAVSIGACAAYHLGAIRRSERETARPVVPVLCGLLLAASVVVPGRSMAFGGALALAAVGLVVHLVRHRDWLESVPVGRMVATDERSRNRQVALLFDDKRSLIALGRQARGEQPRAGRHWAPRRRGAVVRPALWLATWPARVTGRTAALVAVVGATARWAGTRIDPAFLALAEPDASPATLSVIALVAMVGAAAAVRAAVDVQEPMALEADRGLASTLPIRRWRVLLTLVALPGVLAVGAIALATGRLLTAVVVTVATTSVVARTALPTLDPLISLVDLSAPPETVGARVALRVLSPVWLTAIGWLTMSPRLAVGGAVLGVALPLASLGRAHWRATR